MNILIVEDEATIREVEAAYLKQAGYSILEAENGANALAMFELHHVDLVVLDINLPEVDGIEVCKKLREKSTVPIIMVTARIEDLDELISLEVGADDYIKKPFNPSILVARVRSMLRRVGDSKIERGSLIIDPEKMLVVINDTKIDLTTTEFNILYTLAKTPGKVYTRYEIIDKANSNGFEADIIDRTIDVHVKNLRKKIAATGDDTEYIQTVIGKGYRFIDT